MSDNSIRHAELETPVAIDHDDRLQRMIDAYDRPITKCLNESAVPHGDYAHIRRLVRQGIEQAFDAGHACQPGHADQPTDVTWKDHPATHTTGRSIAAKLRAVADALETLGDTEIAPTWSPLSIQVCGNDNPIGRKAAVDAIAAALDLDIDPTPHSSGIYGSKDFRAVSVYTSRLHQPGCCEHCTISGTTS